VGEEVTRPHRWRAVGMVAALLLLAGLAQSTTPATLRAHAARLGQQASAALGNFAALGGTATLPDGRTIRASALALADIPSHYLAHYVNAAHTCPHLSWQLLAAIGKIESDHGRSPAPGVRTGLNRFGCCAGPMQFNLTNGPPSTWTAYAHPGDNVYDPADAIPAAARKLCTDGLARPPNSGTDPCPQVAGPAATHRALKRYNNACWYVHHIIQTATRYTSPATTRAAPAARDPFLVALVADPRLGTTTGRGCDPAPDLASGRMDLRVTSLLAALTERWSVRVSCARSGHSRYVKGTRRLSNHTVWRAVDLDQVDGRPVGPGNRAARQLTLWLDNLSGPLRPSEVGSPWPLAGRPYFTDEGHQGHLHIGFGPERSP
jgi:hypothetical protein